MRQFVAILYRLADHGKTVIACAVIILIMFGSLMSIREGNRVKSLDEISILDIARNLCTHFSYSQTNSPEMRAAALGMYDPAYPTGAIRPTALRAPGYTLFIAPFVFFGGSILHCGF